MAFYKLQDGEIIEAPKFVLNQNYELRAEDRETYQYPVDGWYWFDTNKAATQALTVGTITMRQARLYLLNHDLLDKVQAVIDSIEPPKLRQAAQIEWEYASELAKLNPLVQQIATQLGLDTDQMFREASEL